jgi:hypothetical protein
LLHPLGASSPIAKFLADHPAGGMHHVLRGARHIGGARPVAGPGRAGAGRWRAAYRRP